jgi:hypothetical protein
LPPARLCKLLQSLNTSKHLGQPSPRHAAWPVTSLLAFPTSHPCSNPSTVLWCVHQHAAASCCTG